MRTSTAPVTLLLGLATAACGALDKEDAGRKVDELQSELSGSWLSACEPIGPFGLIELAAERRALTFGPVPGDVALTIHRYEDTSCEKALYRLDVKGTYAVVGGAEGIEGAENLNVTVHKAEMAPARDDAVSAMNEASLCDRTDWQPGVTHDVTGAACDGKTFAEGQVIFDVYDVEGDSLFLGKASFFRDGSSADARPTALDREHPLTRQ